MLASRSRESVLWKGALGDDERFQLIPVATDRELASALESEGADIALIDMEADEAGGALQLIRQIRHEHPDCLIIAHTSYPSLDSALAVLRLGVFDYVAIPAPFEKMRKHVERAMESLDASRARVDEARKTLVKQLAASINHEINNPLASIMGTAELMLVNNRNTRAQRDLETIINQCLRIRAVTMRLRDLPEIRTANYGGWDTMIDLSPAADPVPESQWNSLLSARRKVYIVDPNPLATSAIGRGLVSKMDIVGFAECDDVLEALEQEPLPDAILVDMLLPDSGCFDLITKIHGAYPSTPLFLLAPYHDEEKVSRARRLGAVSAFYKPLVPGLFAEQIQQALAQ